MAPWRATLDTIRPPAQSVNRRERVALTRQAMSALP